MAKPESGRYKAGVDAGKTGDKKAEDRVAAAPLHTGAEAAGTPTPERELTRAEQQQVSAMQQTEGGVKAKDRKRTAWVFLVLGILIIIGLAAAFISIWRGF